MTWIDWSGDTAVVSRTTDIAIWNRGSGKVERVENRCQVMTGAFLCSDLVSVHLQSL